MYRPISATPSAAEHRPLTPDYSNNAVSAQPPEVPGVATTLRPDRPCLFCRYRQASTRSMELDDA
jgi:hypothetical protein